jgi:hypothetical protein
MNNDLTPYDWLAAADQNREINQVVVHQDDMSPESLMVVRKHIAAERAAFLRNDWDAPVGPEDEMKTVPIEDLDLGYDASELDREVQVIDVRAAAAQDRHTLDLG